MRIITSGYPAIDIDAYASMVGYAELLNLQGMPSRAATSSRLNESIPERLRSLRAPVDINYLPEPGESFTLVDVSDSTHFDPMVNIGRLDEVIDHHPGQEIYWRRTLGQRADIQFIGAVATIIYERWARAGLLDTMNPRTAALLASGILDNTLNFQSKVTTQRDVHAYRDLLSIARLPDSWATQYFVDCQQGLERNLEKAIHEDTKVVEFKGQPSVYAVGQIVIWDAQAIVNDHLETIKHAVSSIQPTWFLNVISIKGDRSYFVCTDPGIKTWLTSLLGIKFSGDIAPSDRLWVRKEIIMQALHQYKYRP
jgi:inorganic pyrophosphatase/manganese-dependent inorganic pyrophosphatase